MTRKELRSPDAPPPGGSYSQALDLGDFVYTAGMAPFDASGALVGDDVAAQTHQVLRNLGAVLAEAGLDFSHVVKVTTHLQHLQRDFKAYDEVYREYFPQPYPVRTTVGSDLNNFLVEIDVVAKRP
ncbi:RidA family protein [Yinghuangia seranimata]|uniref:RidA family protein n=1 Tax=Yinghuangia seranimata TaxID=408067 RepID=UPI00248C66D0|nr:Rid family hydrolase [Yinghuangia seranimata]MDI2132805.1 Rid family hydrolase [Yinghuangia seranimata]